MSKADVSSVFNSRSTIIPLFPLDKSPRFSLDMSMSGVAGVLGGDDAVSAMAIVHVYGNRRWLGWYNNPGSYQIARRLTSFAKSASFRSVFSSGNVSLKSRSDSVHTDPTTLFKLDNCKRPKFRAAYSGTVIEETGYLAALLMKECATRDDDEEEVPSRKTQPVRITIAELGQAPASVMPLARTSAYTFLHATIPIVASVSTCALCALAEDWYASLLILHGIVVNGVSCFALGSAEFVLDHPEPAKGSPAGDGILGSDKNIVLLKGPEGAVNSITRGTFSLRFSSKGHYNLIRRCTPLFFTQCITQLLLIPQASLFGQVMFLASLGVSALYNAWVSPWDKEKIHQELLLKRVLGNPRLIKFTLGSRTAAVVFILFVLGLQDPTKLLNELLPNDTRVWTQWKKTISERLCQPSDRWDQIFSSESTDRNLDGYRFTEPEKHLFEQLDKDAKTAHNGYRDYCQLVSRAPSP